MEPGAVRHAADRDTLREMVRALLSEGDVVLVKGSRGMRLDEVAADILEGWA